jgi:hypothetical protein
MKRLTSPSRFSVELLTKGQIPVIGRQLVTDERDFASSHALRQDSLKRGIVFRIVKKSPDAHRLDSRHGTVPRLVVVVV